MAEENVSYISSCEDETCGKDVSVVVKTAGGRKQIHINKRNAVFIAKLQRTKCEGSNNKIVFRNNLFPNDYLYPTNLSEVKYDLGAQHKSQKLANTPVGYNFRTGYEPKLEFKTVQTVDDAWADFLYDYTVGLPLGEDAEVDVIMVYGIVGTKFNERGKVVGGDAIKCIHFQGPLDLDSFGATGDDENITEIKATIVANFTVEPLEIPNTNGDFDKLIVALQTGTGLGKVWDNDCATKILN